jgi:RNA polymerase sigma factor (TIGR02999 family)
MSHFWGKRPMHQDESNDVTGVLKRATEGDESAVNRLMPLVYEELRALAQSYLERERSGHTLQATALVHEAYVRLVDQRDVEWRNRAHFFAVAAQAIRRILVDHARERGRLKRGGRRERVPLDEDLGLEDEQDAELLALDEALTRLAALNQRQAQIVELKYFGGMDRQEVARYLGVSPRTVDGDWSMARAWLRRELREDLS